MPDIDFDAIERRKMLKGMKNLNKKCHCGRMKVNHTVQEARECTKAKETSNVVRQMSQKEIIDMEPRKI